MSHQFKRGKRQPRNERVEKGAGEAHQSRQDSNRGTKSVTEAASGPRAEAARAQLHTLDFERSLPV